MDEEPPRKSDYVTEVVDKITISYMGLAKRLQTPQICERAEAFEQNVHRAVLLAHLPEFVVRETEYLSMLRRIAFPHVQLSAGWLTKSPELLTLAGQQLSAAMARAEAELAKDLPNLQVILAEYTQQLLLFIFNPDTGHPLLEGLQALYISLITNVWTAFEAMVGDLWEAALNIHPKTLADLAGQDKRIAKLAHVKQPPSSELVSGEVAGATIRLDQLHNLTKGTYEIANMLGTILKKRHRFTILDGIRMAYSEAFSKNFTAIDAVLADNSLDRLSALRNVFVHKAGIVDAEYDAKQKAFLDLPQFRLNSKIVLEGSVVRDSVNAVIENGVKLLTTVDEWITKSTK